MRRAVVRILVILTLSLGVNYVVWRWFASVNWSAWWIAVPLVVAETCSLIDAFLFGVTMWRIKERGEPPPPDPRATVDVFVTTYNEPIDLVMTTARAAAEIRYPHQTWVLDDGVRPEMRAAADAGASATSRAPRTGRTCRATRRQATSTPRSSPPRASSCSSWTPTRSPSRRSWTGCWATSGTRRSRWCRPRSSSTSTNSDPLGSQAPLFYGPIQKGKDGWNAAFFCGSNAVLRREALMQLGISGYVKQVERTVETVLKTADSVLAKARSEAKGQDPGVLAAIDEAAAAVRDARQDMRRPGRRTLDRRGHLPVPPAGGRGVAGARRRRRRRAGRRPRAALRPPRRARGAGARRRPR